MHAPLTVTSCQTWQPPLSSGFPQWALLSEAFLLSCNLFIKNIQRLFNFLAYRIDLGIIDWLVNASGKGTIGVSRAAGWTDNNCVDGAVNGTAKGVLGVGNAVRQIQTGQLKTYLSWVVVGIILLAIICGFFIL